MLDTRTRACKICGVQWKVKGVSSHERACKALQTNQAKTRDFARKVRQRENAELLQAISGPSNVAPTRAKTPRAEAPAIGPDPRFGFPFRDLSPSPEPQPFADHEPLPEVPAGPKLNDIKHEYHPHSGLPSKKETLFDYLQSESLRQRDPPTEEKPWTPFRTRIDFEISQFAQENMLNEKATNKLISLIRRCAANPTEFTIVNHDDMNKQWGQASKKCTEFQKFDFEVKYKGVEQQFVVHACPLWDWALDLTRDPRLAPFFVWDAERTYQYNGTKYIRFWTEPWTGNSFWEIQVCTGDACFNLTHSTVFQSNLPAHKDAKLCPYIIYADKAKLSSFGTEKAYPVVARLANVTVGLRNSDGWGGGQVVGSLPVVKDDTAESGKTGYVNFKNAVWHAAFFKLLESIVAHSKTGIWTRCGDGKDRWLFPVILILAADYEEASVMALIRGLRGLYPCPICFVKSDEQSNLSKISTLRTSTKAQEAVKRARSLNAEAREDLLKDMGLRNVDNVFWKVAHSDPYHAISFDRLHSHRSGLWGDHLFSVIKLHVEKLGGRHLAKLDQQFDRLPRWRNLNHFQTVTNISFNDGSKHQDISKMMLYAVHNILTLTDRIGLILLEWVRSYMELDMYVGLDLQTTETIAAGRQVLQKFGLLMEKYKAACVGTEFEEKNWEFIKIHLHQHVFDDIERKGVAKNFGTKIDESMHGPARAAYLRQTNFKDVTPQILRSLHRRMVGKYVLDQLDDLDQLLVDDGDESSDTKTKEPADLEELGNVMIGAKQKSISFLELENTMKMDLAFQNFRIRFANFLSEFLPTYGHALPRGKRVKFNAQDEITPYRYLKVFFQSFDNWMDDTDYLRCNAALVKTATGTIFVRLAFIFACTIEDKTYPFALVQALDVGTGRQSAKDKALSFYRIRERPRKECEFISVHSIIRGALLAPDFDKKGDFLVIDVVDGDMLLRLKEIYPCTD
ncbi:hypothetical protein B0H12DRAFT_1209494 [Mycena haematopus]|nr:hypothetical protein B0H12DRAFT_1209494 [Mycena haematopus]